MSKVEMVSAAVPVAVVTTVEESEEDSVESGSVPTGRLQNSNILQDLSLYLSYMSESQRADVSALIEGFPTIFSDVPSQIGMQRLTGFTINRALKRHG